MTKIIQIKWADAQTLDVGLVNIDELQNEVPVIATIVGYLVAENEKCYVLAEEMWGNSSVKYIHVIPKCSVKNVEFLEVKK